MSDFRINITTDLNDSLAREKLQQLRAEGEKNPLKLKVDVGDIGKLKEVLEITKQIQSVGKSSKAISSPINTSQIKSTVSQFKALQNQYNALQRQLAKETNPKSISVLKSQISSVGKELNKAKAEIERFGSSADKALMKSFSNTSTQKLEASFSKTFSSISERAKSLGTQIQSAFKNPNIDMSQLNSLETRYKGLQNLIKNFDMSKMSGNSLNELNSKVTELESKLKGLNEAARNVKLEDKFKIDCSKLINQLEQMKQKAQSLGKDTTGIQGMIEQVKNLESAVGSQPLGELQNQFNQISNAANKTKAQLSTFATGVKSTFSQIVGSFSMLAPGFVIGTSLVSGIRSVKEEILELDKSMTNLRKVSNEVRSSADIKNVTSDAVKIAKETAGSVSGIVDSIAEMTKLGVKGGLEGAKQAAKFTQIFSNVGDIDISEATKGVATIMNAFELDPTKNLKINVDGATKSVNEFADAMDALDLANNQYPISIQGLLEAFGNGGSTLKSYGMDIKESTALITAAYASIQNGGKVGTGVKSMINNLAGLQTSAKDGSISLNKTAKALKEIAGIDIFTDKTQTAVKTAPQLLDEINQKWDKLNDKQRKALANAIGGKQNSAVFNSVMQNYDMYEEIMQKFANGEHYKMAEKEKQYSPYVQKCA